MKFITNLVLNISVNTDTYENRLYYSIVKFRIVNIVKFKRALFALSVVLYGWCSPAYAQPQETRVALVIGNSNYKSAPLKNPVNDARDMAAKLRGLGFTVIERNNLSVKQIGGTLREFRSKLTPGSVALVYYAGHGLQIKGENYFPTVDAEITGEEDVPNQSLAMRQIMDVLGDSKTRLNLVFLDACRDNPYSRSFRSASKGLIKENAPSGTLISFATRPGSVAADGVGRNGLYTGALLEAMENKGQPIEQVLKRVVTNVKAGSRNQQEPWMEGSIEGEFCFGGCTTVVQVGVSDDRALWESVKDSRDVNDLNAYLRKFPQGLFAEVASNRIKSMTQSSPPVVNQPLPSGSSSSPVQAGVSIADPNDPKTLFNLGVNFQNGSGGQIKNEVEAARLYRLSANQGHAGAQNVLGIFYRDGRGGLAKDDIEAERLFRLSSHQNNAGGHVNLGYFYEAGLGGLAKDEAEAARLYRLSAYQKNAVAQNNLGVLYRDGRGGLAKNDVEAAKLFLSSASQGHARGQVNLGFFYSEGRGGLAKDDVEAVRLYRLSANQGNAAAQNSLGVFYREGRGGLAKDDVEAARLFLLSANQNNANAQVSLGAFHATGRGGLPKDDVQAERLYRLSANQGNAVAQSNLGNFYREGRGGLTKDMDEAIRLYKLAAKQNNVNSQEQLKKLGIPW